MASMQQSVISSMAVLFVLFFLTIENSVLMLLFFFYKDMLEKVSMY